MDFIKLFWEKVTFCEFNFCQSIVSVDIQAKLNLYKKKTTTAQHFIVINLVQN